MLRRLLILALFLVIMLLIYFRSSGDVTVARRGVSTPSVLSKPEYVNSPGPRTPPLWQPLQVSQSTLMELASSGDRTAADRLFAESMRCLKAIRMKDFFKGMDHAAWLAENRKLLEAMDPPTRARTMTTVNANIELIETSSQLCENAKAGLSDGQIYGIALAAARLGNDDATACLLGGFYDPPKMNPEQAQAFHIEAMKLGRRALNNGNWNTVLALQTVYATVGVEGQTGPVSHISHADYLKVLSLLLRGTPRNASELLPLEQQVKALELTLSPADRFAAERWADDMYARVFFASGPAPSMNSTGCDY